MPRPDGSVNISRPVSEYIIEMAITYLQAPPEEILGMAVRFASEIGDDTLREDQIETVKRRVRTARQKLSDEDEPWSLSRNPELLDRLVPPSARRDVLDVSMWHLIGGTPFSFRQAKWVARLRKSFAKDDRDRYSYELAKYASSLAGKERWSEATGQDFDASGLEMQLAIINRTQRDVDSQGQLTAMFMRDHDLSTRAGIKRLIASSRWRYFLDILDTVATSVFKLCPQAPHIRGSIHFIADRGLFELVVLRLRRTGSDDFLKSSPEEQYSLVNHLWELALQTPLSSNEWPLDWDEWDD